MPKIAFIYTGGRKNRLEAIAKKESPEDFFYGALELRRRGYDVSLLEDADFNASKRSLFTICFGFIFRYLGLDAGAFAGFRNSESLQQLNQFDILIATTNTHGIVLGLLRKFGKIKSKVIFLSMCPLFPEDNFFKKRIYRGILNQMFLAVENTNEVVFLNKFFGSAAPGIAFVPFGVDGAFWRPGDSHRGEYVLSMGNDSTRDFETLVKAWQPHYPELKIITRRDITAPIPANVTLIRGDWNKQYLSDSQIREYIQRARWVMIPTRESLRSSGPSVAMQSLACGKLVMLSKTAGLWDERVLRDGETCILLAPGSVEDIRRNVERVLTSPKLQAAIEAQARPTMEKCYTIQRYADDLEKIFTQI